MQNTVVARVKIVSMTRKWDLKSSVNDHIYSLVAMAGNVVILSQSENKIVFRIRRLYPALETQGLFWNVSYAEMM